MARARSWCFTINNYLAEDILAVDDMCEGAGVSYCVYGEEEGEEGTPHIQGYVVFREGRSMSAVSKNLPRAHLEVAKGSAKANRAYCTKEDDTPFEYGVMPLTPVQRGENEQQRWATIKQQAQSGDLEAIEPEVFIKHYTTLKRIAVDFQPSVPDAGDVTGEWFYGEAGAGKSWAARKMFPGSYFKMCNKWWDGYQGEDNVIIDDFDTTHAVLAHHLKIWGDRYSFLAEMKGSARVIRPKKILVTSQYHPEEIWHDDATLAAIKRRYHMTKFSKMSQHDNTE